MSTTVVFVHGWSVTNLDTYGELPLRLLAEAAGQGMDIKVEEIFLGRYISFNDEVELVDIARAFDMAVKEQLAGVDRFVCITHSTGGPVIRDWWNRYYKNKKSPLSHLIMLAPANFGSALAQLGKSKLSRIKAWFDGVEPGQGVLDWLAIGSSPSWSLNREWIHSDGSQIGPDGVFPFVITGQSIDRKLYDHLNSYTGELGSDGVVRASTANLNAIHIKLVQEAIVAGNSVTVTSRLDVADYKESPAVPFRIVKGKSHSGDRMGIMKSVQKDPSDAKSAETVRAIFDCLKVKNKGDYQAVIEKFKVETDQVQKDELIEPKDGFFGRIFIHDRFSQVVFRVTDTEGNAVKDYDLVFTAGPDNSPDQLPPGFAIDRQQNRNNPDTVTYYFNYDVMNGAPANAARPEIKSAVQMGLQLWPRPDEGFVRYVPCHIEANADLLDRVLKPNTTTLIDICIQRVVSKEVFRLEKLPGNAMPTQKGGDFSDTDAGDKIIA
jgi:hypothetical protein